MVPRLVSPALIVLIVAFIAGHLFFPNLAIDTVTLALLGLLIVVVLLPFAKSISLPGGAGIELRDIEKAREAVEIATSDSAKGLESISVYKPTDQVADWRLFLRTDTNVALAGLRIEIEKRIRELIQEKAASRAKFEGLGELTRVLREREVLTPSEEAAVRRVVEVCNRAVHAQYISPEAAQMTSELGEQVLRMLDSKLAKESTSSAGNP